MSNRYEKTELGKFEEMIMDHNSQISDYYCPVLDMEYIGNKQARVFTDTGLGMSEIVGSFNANGFRQLCQRIKAPHQWLNSGRCPDDLEKTIINRLKKETDGSKTHLFRLKNDTIRAVLSDKYLVYNHAQFWNDIKEALAGTDLVGLNPVIWKPSVSHHLDAWLLFDNVDADPHNGEQIRMYDGGDFGGLRPAIHIRNTEDGTGKVRIDSGFFRSYCTNGVLFGWKNKNVMSAEHLGKYTAHLEIKVAMAIADAAATCQLGISKFVESTKIRIKEEAINSVVKEWTRVYSIESSVSEQWGEFMRGATTWGDLVMATSDFAGTLEDRDTTFAMEEISGNILFAKVPHRHVLS